MRRRYDNSACAMLQMVWLKCKHMNQIWVTIERTCKHTDKKSDIGNKSELSIKSCCSVNEASSSSPSDTESVCEQDPSLSHDERWCLLWRWCALHHDGQRSFKPLVHLHPALRRLKHGFCHEHSPVRSRRPPAVCLRLPAETRASPRCRSKHRPPRFRTTHHR